MQSYFTASIGAMTNSIVSIGGNIASFFIAIVLSIYLMQDSEYFIDLWNKIFNLIFGKSKAGNKLKEILCTIDDTFYKYIRGQLLEACHCWSFISYCTIFYWNRLCFNNRNYCRYL